jgi:lysophospholipase L1-like esterase
MGQPISECELDEFTSHARSARITPDMNSKQPARPETSFLHALRALVAVVAAYALFSSLAAAARLEAIQWGLLMTRHAESALRINRNVHLAVFLACLIAHLVFRRRHSVSPNVSPLAPRILLAAMPLLFLISVDLWCSVYFEPFVDKQGLYLPHPTRDWTMRPNWKGWDHRAWTETNSDGLRGPEIEHPKPPDVKRLVFLGDSLAFGLGLEEPVTFVARMRKHLERQNTARFSVVNLSVNGYSPWHEYDLLLEVGLPLAPDVIIHVFCLNDVLERFQLERFGGYSRGFEPALPTPLEWSGLYRAVREWHAARLRPTQEELWRLRAFVLPSRLFEAPDAEDVQKAWQMTLSSMADIVAVAKERSIPFVLVCAPYLPQLLDKHDGAIRPQAILEDFARDAGVPFFDLDPPFRQRMMRDGLDPHSLFFDPLHFSEAGHAIAAEVLLRYLDENDLLN